MTRIPQTLVRLGMAERRAVDRVLRSGQLVQGAEVAAFESEFAASVVADRGSVAVNSGTSALHLGLVAAGIGPGDEVVVPSFTYAGTVNAIRLTGAKPVYCDIDSRTFCAAPDSVKSLVGPATAAIMVVHMFGHPAAMDELQAVADAAGVPLIEDACQSHGARWRSHPVGAFGRFAAFSFYPTKNMTTGEGGMIVSGDEALLDRARLLRNQGAVSRYDHRVVGYNNRMTEVAAAIGRVQLSQLPRRNLLRHRIAHRYDSALTTVRVPYLDPSVEHAFHQYTVRVPDHVDRDRLRADLLAQGIGTGVYYSVPCHRLEPLAADVDLPATEAAATSVLSLPIYPELRDAEISAVADEVDRLVTSYSASVGAIDYRHQAGRTAAPETASPGSPTESA